MLQTVLAARAAEHEQEQSVLGFGGERVSPVYVPTSGVVPGERTSFAQALRSVERSHLEALEDLRIERDDLARQLKLLIAQSAVREREAASTSHDSDDDDDGEEVVVLTHGSLGQKSVQIRSSVKKIEADKDSDVVSGDTVVSETVTASDPSHNSGSRRMPNRLPTNASMVSTSSQRVKFIGAFMVRREWRIEDDYVMRMQRRGEWNLAAAAASIRVSFDLGPIMQSSGNDAWIFFSPDPPWTFVPIMHPFSGPRLYWNLPCIMLICYDIFFVPLESSFDVPFHISFRIVDWFITLFWTADLLFSFFSGYYNGRTLEMRPSMVWKHYATTWLWLDLVVVSTEWASRYNESVVGGFAFLRFSRALRFVRFIKLVRIFKFNQALRVLEDQFNSNVLLILSRLGKLLITLSVFAHLVACAWYGLGRNAWDNNGWETYYADEIQASNGYVPSVGSWESLFFWYFASARWTLAQINGRTDQDSRRNMTELMFTCLVSGGLAIIFMAVFVSAITTTMLEVSELNRKRNERLLLLNEYIDQYSISQSLKYRLKSTAQTWKEAKTMQWEVEARVLATLPRALQEDVKYETRKVTAVGHPMLYYFSVHYHRLLRHISHAVLKPLTGLGEEVIFDVGDACTRMLFVHSGATLYTVMDGVGEMQNAAGTFIASSGRHMAQDDQRISRVLRDHMAESIRNTRDDSSFRESSNHISRTSWSPRRHLPSTSGVIQMAERITDRGKNSDVPLPEVTHKSRSTRISEAALWLGTWENRGRLVAVDDCCFLAMEGSDLAQVLCQYKSPHAMAVLYARSFANEAARRSNLSDVTSIRFIWSTHEDMDSEETVNLGDIMISDTAEDSG